MIRTLITSTAVIVMAVSLTGCASTGGRVYYAMENGEVVRKVYKSPHHNPAATQGSLSTPPAGYGPNR